jgi:hypothetical protein
LAAGRAQRGQDLPGRQFLPGPGTAKAGCLEGQPAWPDPQQRVID